MADFFYALQRMMNKGDELRLFYSCIRGICFIFAV